MPPGDHDGSFYFGRPLRPASVRRRITPEAGRGLEKLGHAVEYLTDEFVHDGCRFVEDRGRVEAIELLASLNRQIYFSCEVVPTLRERIGRLFRHLWKSALHSELAAAPRPVEVAPAKDSGEGQRLSRYHSTVRLKPSRKSTWGA